MINLGNFAVNATVRIPWNTNAATGASITRSGNGTIRIYKNATTTPRSSANGVTDNEDFNGKTGVHLLVIDLSDNTDAGFYAAGNDYFAVIDGATIDGQTVNACLGTWSIENRSAGTVSTADIADAVLLRATSNVEASVTAGAKKTLAALIMMATHLAEDLGTGSIRFYQSDGTTTSFDKAVISTDASLQPIKKIGGAA